MHKASITGALLAALLLAGAGCPAQTQPSAPAESEAPSSTETAASEVVITFTETGYSPSSVTIKKGGTVTFVNESEKDMWPASAMHPTHKVYPTTGGCIGSTFDACTRVKTSDAWSFSFDEVGEWKFHDHLSPSFFGSITVVE
jgi:plastocyanin